MYSGLWSLVSNVILWRMVLNTVFCGVHVYMCVCVCVCVSTGILHKIQKLVSVEYVNPSIVITSVDENAMVQVAESCPALICTDWQILQQAYWCYK